MSVKLSLARDFTRFLRDPTFPHKVTVCIGEEQLNCSGAVLAQQSSVLERKFREDNGVLMFEEFLDIDGSCSSILKCIEYLHGADLEFDVETLTIVLKFASIYQVEDLFEQAVIWLVNHLKTSKSAKTAVQFLKVAYDLSDEYSIRMRRQVGQFIQSNSIVFENDLNEILEIGISGSLMIFLCKHAPSSIGSLLTKWVALSDGNKDFIIKNQSKITFPVVFSPTEQFISFVDSLSSGTLSNDSLRALLDLQRSYFAPKERCGKTPCSSVADTQAANSGIPVNKRVVKKRVEMLPRDYDYKLLHSLRENQILIGNLPPDGHERFLRMIIENQEDFFQIFYNPNLEIVIDHDSRGNRYGVITFTSTTAAIYLWKFVNRLNKKPLCYSGFELQIMCNPDLVEIWENTELDLGRII